MNLIWVGLLFFSHGWLFLLPIFDSAPNRIFGAAFFLAGAILAFLGMKSLMGAERKGIEGDRSANHGADFFWQGAFLTATLLTLQAIIVPVYWMIGARYHHLNFLSPVLYHLSRAIGLEVTLSQNTLFVQTYEHVIPFTTNWEKFAAYPAVNFLIGGMLIILLFFSAGVVKKGLAFLGITLGYLMLRYVILLLIFAGYQNPIEMSHPYKASLFWNPYYILLSLLPLALLLSKFVNLSLADVYPLFRRPFFRKGSLVLYVLAALFAFSLVGFKMFQDPGTLKVGRVLFDQAHSPGWEATDKKMDTEWYGTQSVYNYYCLAEWLNHYFSVEKHLSGPLTPDLLRNYDVLVIYTPTTKFADHEIHAVTDYVRGGGGLLLLGDHTNLLGSTAYLNRLTQPFSFQFNYDCTNSLSTGYFSTYRPPALFRHPIVQKLQSFDFLSSCTLTAPVWAEEVIIGYDLYSDPMDYSRPPNFFGKNFPTTENGWGLFVQAVALKFGRGRVVAIGDSTPWSNFALFQGGHSEWMLGAVSFLNLRNRYGYVFNYVFLGLALFSVFTGAALLRRLKEKKILIPSLLAMVLLSGLTAGWILQKINDRNHPQPAPRSPYTRISFLKSHSNFELPAGLGHSLYSPEVCFDVFYEWTQRIEYVPSVASSLDDALRNGDAIVVINPVKSFSSKEQKKIVKYVAEGGKLLVLDTILNPGSTANQLLTNFGMSVTYKPVMQEMMQGESKERKAQNPESSKELYVLVPTIIGGNPVWSAQNGIVLFSIANQGKGRVAALVDSYAFSKAMMGHPMEIPDPVKRKLYDAEFDIFKRLFSKNEE
jgi:hypothetical protein